MSEKPYLSIGEVAKRFGVNSTTVYRMAQQGLLPGFKFGNQWRFSETMLKNWEADRITVERFRIENRKAG